MTTKKPLPKVPHSIRISPAILVKVNGLAVKQGKTISLIISEILEKHFKKSKA